MIKNILLAEDERGTALLIKTQLERYGYSVHAVGNGLEALEILKDERVDLVVTDVVMPEMDGVDLFQALKRDRYLADIPVIIVTDKPTFLEAFSALGVNHFLAKADIRDLVGKIKEIDALRPDKNPLIKILVCGENGEVVEQMRTALRSKGYLVVVTDKALESITKAVEMTPHVVILDALMKKYMTAPELVRALRVFDALRNCSILSYVDFDPKALALQAGFMDTLEIAAKASLAAGADQYIGRFNRVTFLDQVQEFMLSKRVADMVMEGAVK